MNIRVTAKNIKVRGKMKKHFTPAEIHNIQKFIARLLIEPEDFVTSFVWSYYNGSNQQQKFAQFCNFLAHFSEANQERIIQEFEHHYRKVHPSFLSVPESFENLKSVQELNPILAHVVCAKISYAFRVFPERNVNNCLALLKDPKENRYYGGLRMLGFDEYDSNFLKEHIKEIASLYEEAKEVAYPSFLNQRNKLHTPYLNEVQCQDKHEDRPQISAGEAKSQKASDNVSFPEPQTDQAATEPKSSRSQDIDTSAGPTENVSAYSKDVEAFLEAIRILKSLGLTLIILL